MIVFFWGATTFYKTVGEAPYGSLEIDVFGSQWQWAFVYEENGIDMTDTLVVPVNKPVKLTLTSDEVLHSFYVPEFRIKMDVIPKRYTPTWFEPTNTGTYDILCTEYCGDDHSLMLGKVIVLEEDDYNQWMTTQKLNKNKKISPKKLGENMYHKHKCYSCHYNGDPEIKKKVEVFKGPDFVGLFGTEVTHTDGTSAIVNANYIRESIEDPLRKIVSGREPLMSSYARKLDDAEINGLIKYIESLSTVSKEEEKK